LVILDVVLFEIHNWTPRSVIKQLIVIEHDNSREFEVAEDVFGDLLHGRTSIRKSRNGRQHVQTLGDNYIPVHEGE
jgi:hypothetical protein